MNATQLVFQAQGSNDSQQVNLTSGANSQSAQANNQGFAGALNDAHPAQARKSPANTQHREKSSGGRLPHSGNPAPTAAPKAGNEVVSGRRRAKERTATVPGASAPPSGAPEATSPAAGGVPPAAAPPGGAPPPAPPVATAAVAAGIVVSASPVVSAGPAPQLLSAADPALPSVATLVFPDTASESLQGASSNAPATGAAASGNAKAVPVGMLTAGQPIAAADSTIDSTQGTAPAATDATPNGAQAVMAAAIAQGASPPRTDTSTDFMATDLGTALVQGDAAVSGRLATLPGLAEGAPARSSSEALAALSSATAASVAQLTATGGTAGSGPGSDRHSRGGGSDSFLSGTFNDGTVAAQLLSSANSTVSDSSPAPTVKVSAGVDSAQFGQGVADGVGVMMDGNMSCAKLQVNPPALGPIEVRISLQAGHAQVWFTSHSAVTRDALESSTPKLRELLGAQGFGQVSVDISQRSFQERSPQARGYEALTAMSTGVRASADPSIEMSRAASGLLDAYA